MNRNIALLLVLVFLAASCTIFVRPALSFTDVAENSWAAKAPMHEVRADLGVAVVNGRIYAIGGSLGNGVVTGMNEEYDPETDTWTLKTPLPYPSGQFAIAVHMDNIYCIGEGETRVFNLLKMALETKGIEFNQVYNPATDKWENKTPAPIHQISAQANVVNNKIYLLGGYPNTTLNEVYDPITDNWTINAPMPIQVNGASIVYENRIYVMGNHAEGGYFDSNDDYIPSQFTYVTQVYDPETDVWSSDVTSPNGVGYGIAGATTGLNAPKRIYLFSGGIQYFDPVSGEWGSGAGMLTSRSGYAIAVLNDQLYAIGGYTTTYITVSPESSIYDWMRWNADGGAVFTYRATVEVYTPFGYGTVPPNIQVVPLENNVAYSGADVSLNFTLNKAASWMGYSLDGQDNVTVTGNITLSGLSDGWHNVTVYAEDSLGNMGASETIIFNVASPFPTVPIAIASGASAIAVAAGLVVYFKKFKKKQ